MGYLLLALCVVLVVLPPRWDPAIRLKEWALEQRRKRGGSDHG